MSDRISKTFLRLKEENKKALITYITSGDPDIETTEQLVYAMEKEGADIIELGIPYSDPLADGPVIQSAAARALKNNVNADTVFELVERIRQNTQIPIAFLLYYNSIFPYGVERFIKKCEHCGVDGLIIPDLPLEERKDMQNLLKDKNIDLIPLVAPTSDDRIKEIVKGATGFVYCVSSLGVTGVRKDFGQIDEFMEKVRKNTQVPTAIGFGISGGEAVKMLKDKADGLIIGSAIIKKIEEGLLQKNSISKVEEFMRELKSGIES